MTVGLWMPIPAVRFGARTEQANERMGEALPERGGQCLRPFAGRAFGLDSHNLTIPPFTILPFGNSGVPLPP